LIFFTARAQIAKFVNEKQKIRNWIIVASLAESRKLRVAKALRPLPLSKNAGQVAVKNQAQRQISEAPNKLSESLATSFFSVTLR